MEQTRTAVPGDLEAEPQESPTIPEAGGPSTAQQVFSKLSFRNISAVYVWLVLFITFAIWVPKTFLTSATLTSVLGQYSMTMLVAVGLVIPLAAGAYDLSIGQVLGGAGVTAAWALSQGWPWPLAVVSAIAVGVVAGALSGILVRLGINSFIATLGMSSILAAYITWRSGNQEISILNLHFQNLALTQWFGISTSVYVALAVSVVVWYVLEKRPVGRHIYATGGNVEAARLAGVRTNLIVFGTLVTSATIAALAGVINAGRSGVGSPTVGATFLIPAFAAAFLGSTQLRRGQFNVWGTVIAVYVLATGVRGLELAGAQSWVTDLFNGVALLLAVGISVHERRQATSDRRFRWWRQRRE